jgi:hypothetical protein
MKTDWAQGFSEDQYKAMEAKSLLGRIADIDDVADAAIGLMCNRSITVGANFYESWSTLLTMLSAGHKPGDISGLCFVDNNDKMAS